MATCLIFGLMPAIRATSTEPGAAMKAGSRGSTDSRERFGLRRGLVVVAGGAVARARRRRAAVRPQPAQPDDARRRLPAGRHSDREPRLRGTTVARGRAPQRVRRHDGHGCARCRVSTPRPRPSSCRSAARAGTTTSSSTADGSARTSSTSTRSARLLQDDGHADARGPRLRRPRRPEFARGSRS